MRSFTEIAFRLQQEVGNVRLLLNGPHESNSDAARITFPEPPIPDTAADLAEFIASHRIPLLGHIVETGTDVRWRRDYISGIESGTEYFRRIPYLDAALVGDHKMIWELNRHQHLVVLAQAWKLSKNRRFLDEIPRQIASWWEQNPFMRGINWASALEVAFRALSWIRILHLCGDDLPPDFRQRLGAGILAHGAYLENNLSVYFSPNTHLLGEAVALHAIGTAFPDHPRAARWRSRGGEIVSAQILHQVREDGSHFEQSSAYQVYALDFFLLHARLCTVTEPYRARLGRMAEYLGALVSGDGWMPLLGDDDGGNLFHPFGNQRQYALRTLAGCREFFQAEDDRSAHESHLFQDAGVAILSRKRVHIVADTRGFGHAGAGHSHAHALNIVCRCDGQDILIDPGTYTYTGEPEWRDRFRGTAFHNTVRVDGRDQATPAGPFRWTNKPKTEVLRWTTCEEWSYLHVYCSYRDIRHERYFVWLSAPEVLVIADVVQSSSSEPRLVEQFWHCGGEVRPEAPGIWSLGGAAAVLAVPAESKARIEAGGLSGWRSESPGNKVESSVIVVEQSSIHPGVMAAALFLRPEQVAGNTRVEVKADHAAINIRAGDVLSIRLRNGDDPELTWS